MASALRGAASPFARRRLPLKSGFLSEPCRDGQGEGTWCFLHLKPWLKSCNQSTTGSTAAPEFLPEPSGVKGDAASPCLVQRKPLEPALRKPWGCAMPLRDAHFSVSLDFPPKREGCMCTTERLHPQVRQAQAQWEAPARAPGGLCSPHQEGLRSSVGK